jgi:Protein of unknown function (DUF4019)
MFNWGLASAMLRTMNQECRGGLVRVFVFVLLVLLPSLVQAQPDQKIEAAKESADRWLNLVDSGSFNASWMEASGAFKGGITRDSWQNIWSAVRAPLGPFQSRTFKKGEYRVHIPEDPKEDKWILIEYDSAFANRSVVEVITSKQEKDGQWRVAGYDVVATSRSR